LSADLTLWMPDVLAAPWIWWQSDTECGEVKTDAEKATLKSLDYKSLKVILSGQSVRIFPHDLPQMRASERIKAAAIFVEDLLAGTSKDHHIVMGVGDDRRLAVISKDRMSTVKEHLSKMGLTANSITADFDALPLHIGTVRLDDRIISAGPNGYTLDKNWAGLNASNASHSDAPKPRDAYAIISELEIEPAINLAQGEFAALQNFMPNFAGFKRAAVLLVVLGVTWLFWQGAQWRSMTAQADAMKSEASELYFKTVGTRANNPALEVTRAIKAGPKSDGDFLSLSSLLFDSLSDIDGIEIDRLQYDRGSNALSLRIFYPSFASVSRLEKNITARGGVFESGGVREQSNKMIGEATLKFGAGR